MNGDEMRKEMKRRLGIIERVLVHHGFYIQHHKNGEADIFLSKMYTERKDIIGVVEYDNELDEGAAYLYNVDWYVTPRFDGRRVFWDPDGRCYQMDFSKLTDEEIHEKTSALAETVLRMVKMFEKMQRQLEIIQDDLGVLGKRTDGDDDDEEED